MEKRERATAMISEMLQRLAEGQRLEMDRVAVLRLWSGGDTRARALAVLHGIKEDAAALP
ncbi:hypothetical protein SLUN_37080 [Streptomyces lunaelactis]|uniref:Uncharacterized protein n=1 Tax=Streptomyces lunaelactis TaxID=1535768 RepID=A0A2R4TCX1_9ACTN|nr:hypothetical protein [Streptomyces lunaelactis]AVZ76965.1 hypothetical protein SLUN_37080 [Streptomyces lunaelactis]NUK83271.1 hypothetical protein [Streptomyces lunaelactis]